MPKKETATTLSIDGREVPGRFYYLRFDLEPDDEFVPAGKQLAVTIDLAHSSFSISIVGGKKALSSAGVH